MYLPEFKAENLDGMISSYYQNKESLDNYKEIVDEENKWIKEMLSKSNLSEYVTIDGLKAKITTQKRESFIEDKLLLKLKELGITTPIKTVEIIDYNELENAIYNGKLNAAELVDCKQIKEIATLKISKKKGE